MKWALVILCLAFSVWETVVFWPPPDRVTPIPVTSRGLFTPEEHAAFVRQVVEGIANDTKRVLETHDQAQIARQIRAVRIQLGGTDTPAIVDAYREELRMLEAQLGR